MYYKRKALIMWNFQLLFKANILIAKPATNWYTNQVELNTKGLLIVLCCKQIHDEKDKD